MKKARGHAQRDRLIEEYQNYVESVAARLIKTLALPAELFDELVSAGNLGLVEAAGRYDPASGTDFRTFAYLRIRGAIIDSLRSSSELSGRAYRYAKAFQAAQALREDDLLVEQVKSTEDTSKKKASSRDQSLAKIFDYAARGALVYRLSTEDVPHELSSLQSEDPNPELQLQNQQEQDFFREILDELPKNERLIIEEYYFKGQTFLEIAENNKGLSKSWISRLHSRALERIKQRVIELRGDLSVRS